MNQNESKWMNMNGNEKTKFKLQKKYTLSDNWNTYDLFGEAFFFAPGPFFIDWLSVWLTQHILAYPSIAIVIFRNIEFCFRSH